MGEQYGVSSVSSVGSIVPHFYYDLIGRIIPGAFLILATPLVTNPDGVVSGLTRALREPAKLEATGLILAFVAFTGASYLAGLLLGALSYSIEWLWKRCRPWIDSDIPTSLPKSDQWKTAVGFSNEPQAGNSVEEFARASGIFAWGINPSVGAMGSRWDAEALAGRSILLVTGFLAALSVGRPFHPSYKDLCFAAVFSGGVTASWFLAYKVGPRRERGVTFVGGVLVALWIGVVCAFHLCAWPFGVTTASFFQYSYARERRVMGKFQIVEALLPLTKGTGQ